MPIAADRAEAAFEHGELVLTLPKAESAKPRQIKIGGATQAQPVISGKATASK
jgi:HSP20 family protein